MLIRTLEDQAKFTPSGPAGQFNQSVLKKHIIISYEMWTREKADRVMKRQASQSLKDLMANLA